MNSVYGFSNIILRYDLFDENNFDVFGDACIYSKKDELRYKVSDKKTGKTIKGPIDLNNHSKEKVIDYFRRCRPKFSEKEGLTFKPHLPPDLMPFAKELKFDLEELKIYCIRRIQQWILRDQVVSVLRKENDLYYEVLDKKSGHISKGPIDLDNKEIDSAISYLSQCQPKISEAGTISFVPKIATLMVPGNREDSLTLEEKENLSLTMPHIRRWIFDDKEISLVRRENVLVYEIFDNLTGQLTEGPIDLDGHDITNIISYLSHCYPEISEGGVTFSSAFEGFDLRHEWSFRNKTLSLLEKNSQFFWELYDESTKTYSRTPFASCYLYWNKMAKNYYVDPSKPISMLFLSLKRRYQLDSCLRLLMECDIEKMEMELTPYSSVPCLKSVYAKKIVKPSQLDPNVIIDNYSWAVTLINSGTSHASNPLTWGGHAAILIEGIKDGKFFIYKTHLRMVEGSTKISLEKIEKKNIFYSQKGKTWEMARWDVEKMLEAIQWEVRKEKLKKPQVFFDINGSDSKLVKPVSIKEYSSYQDLIEQTLKKGLNGYLNPACQSAIIIQDRNGNKKRITKEGEDSFWSAPDFIGRFFVQSPTEDKWTEYVLPDNCLTWAKRKLSDWCGVHFEGNFIDAVYALPRNYMNRELGITDPELSDYSIEANKKGHQGVNSTPLKVAILEGNINKVRYFLQQEVDLSLQEYGFNVLHTACELGLTRIVRLLLKKGMDPNEPTNKLRPNYTSLILDFTPLILACLRDNEDLIKLLLKSGARINQAYGSSKQTVLHFVVLVCKSLPLIEFLIEHGANVNAEDKSEKTPLDIAIENQELEIARLLLIHGARIDGLKMLRCACKNNDIDMLRLLVENDFDWKDVIRYRSFSEDFIKKWRSEQNNELADFLQKVIEEQRVKYFNSPYKVISDEIKDEIQKKYNDSKCVVS